MNKVKIEGIINQAQDILLSGETIKGEPLDKLVELANQLNDYTKGGLTMQVINKNKKGEIIDLSKITLSKELSEQIVKIVLRSDKK